MERENCCVKYDIVTPNEGSTNVLMPWRSKDKNTTVRFSVRNIRKYNSKQQYSSDLWPLSSLSFKAPSEIVLLTNRSKLLIKLTIKNAERLILDQ